MEQGLVKLWINVQRRFQWVCTYVRIKIGIITRIQMLKNLLADVEGAGIAAFNHILMLKWSQIVVSFHLLERTDLFGMVLDVILSGELSYLLDI